MRVVETRYKLEISFARPLPSNSESESVGSKTGEGNYDVE